MNKGTITCPQSGLTFELSDALIPALDLGGAEAKAQPEISGDSARDES